MYQNILINRVTELRLRVQKKYCDDPKLRPPCSSSQCAGGLLAPDFFMVFYSRKSTSLFIASLSYSRSVMDCLESSTLIEPTSAGIFPFPSPCCSCCSHHQQQQQLCDSFVLSFSQLPTQSKFVIILSLSPFFLCVVVVVVVV